MANVMKKNQTEMETDGQRTQAPGGRAGSAPDTAELPFDMGGEGSDMTATSEERPAAAAMPRWTGRNSERPRTRNERTRRSDEQISYNILSHLGTLGHSSSGWSREVNIVSWNRRQPRLDIRDWSPQHTRMSRGIALNANETDNLKGILMSFNAGQYGL